MRARSGLLRTGLLLGSIAIMGVLLTAGWEAKAEPKPRLAILPFLAGGPEDMEKGAVCPVCKGVYRKGNLPPGARDALTRLLYQKIEARGTFTVVPSEAVDKAFDPLDRKTVEQKPILSALQLGKELNADFVFVGFLFRFEERVGSRMGVEKPASVAFDLHLFRLRDERIVWMGKFDETQRPLSEDMTKIGSFFRRGAQWLTAEELAGAGMEDMLKKLPAATELEN